MVVLAEADLNLNWTIRAKTLLQINSAGNQRKCSTSWSTHGCMADFHPLLLAKKGAHAEADKLEAAS